MSAPHANDPPLPLNWGMQQDIAQIKRDVEETKKQIKEVKDQLTFLCQRLLSPE